MWALVRLQHGVISHAQLRALGYSRRAIEHRLARGRLFRLFRGVYAVGRPNVGQLGMWMAAVLACGEGAYLSHESAGHLHGFWRRGAARIHVSVVGGRDCRPAEIAVHRRKAGALLEVTTRLNIPVTSPADTLLDLAARYGRISIERAVNEADGLDVLGIDELYEALDRLRPGRPGLRVLRSIIEPGAFVLTDSELEQLFVPIAMRAGLGRPVTATHLNGFQVDFHFPDLRIVVEADGGRFHRTPAQQTRDRLRDHAHAVAGLLPVRFTHQVARDAAYVERTLRKLAARARRRKPGGM